MFKTYQLMMSSKKGVSFTYWVLFSIPKLVLCYRCWGLSSIKELRERSESAKIITTPNEGIFSETKAHCLNSSKLSCKKKTFDILTYDFYSPIFKEIGLFNTMMFRRILHTYRCDDQAPRPKRYCYFFVD